MDYRGMPWKNMEYRGIEWNILEYYGRTWNIGNTMEYRGISWNAMGYRGMPWNIEKHHRISWNDAKPFRASQVPQKKLGLQLLQNVARMPNECLTKLARVALPPFWSIGEYN